MTREMQSGSQIGATGESGDTFEDVSELDPKALAAIRNLLNTQPEVAAEPVIERLSERAAQTALPDIDQPPASPSRVSVERAPSPKRKPKPEKTAPKRRGVLGRIKSSVLRYRPSLKVAIWISFAFLVFMRPLLVIGLTFIGLLAMICLFLIVGYDGFWRGAMGMARWYAGRRPNRAAELHRKLDAFALKWDAVLDRFPEGTVDGLYLPDFGNMATADARHDAALDRRFANLTENEG